MLYFSASTHPPHLIWDLVLRSPYLSCKDSQASLPAKYIQLEIEMWAPEEKKANSVIFFSPHYESAITRLPPSWIALRAHIQISSAFLLSQSHQASPTKGTFTLTAQAFSGCFSTLVTKFLSQVSNTLYCSQRHRALISRRNNPLPRCKDLSSPPGALRQAGFSKVREIVSA